MSSSSSAGGPSRTPGDFHGQYQAAGLVDASQVVVDEANADCLGISLSHSLLLNRSRLLLGVVNPILWSTYAVKEG